MTDNEIIKALKFCSTKNKCNECAFQPYCSKGEILDEYVLDLINRQKAEIEREHKIVCDYAQAARTIELYLLKFCDKKLPYDEMIADASRKASAEIDRLNLKIRDLNKERVEFSKMHWNDWEIHCNAIKEFAERLKDNYNVIFGRKAVSIPDIDNLVKEMTVEKECEK